MNAHCPAWIGCFITAAFLFVSVGYAVDKQRAVVLTDIRSAHEPDDAQSLVRLLCYANVIDIKGLVVNTSIYGKSVVSKATGLSDIRTILDAYSKALPNLQKLDPAFPSKDALRAIACNGQTTYGLAGVGAGKSTDGSNLIIDEILTHPDDQRPLWILGWGGINSLAQALYDVANNTRPGKTYSPDDLRTLVSRIRVYEVAGQDDTGAIIAKQYPDIVFLRSTLQFRAMSYRVDGIWAESRGGNETFCSQQWFTDNISHKHGPLGAQYRMARYLFEGDTPSFLFLIPNGLSDPDHINWGSWGGRFNAQLTTQPGNTTRASEPPDLGYQMHTPAADTWTTTEVLVNNVKSGSANDVTTTINKTYTDNVYAPLFRFRPAVQNDFAARMNWAAGIADANRNPIAVLNGDTTLKVLTINVAPGAVVKLSAAGSSDPDGDGLTYQWWVYREAGSYDKPLTIHNTDQSLASLTIPADAAGCEIHVILEITDTHAALPLTAYRRLVITVAQPTR